MPAKSSTPRRRRPLSYPKGKYNPLGLGKQLLRAGPNGAVAYIGCNTGGQPCGLTLMDGFTKSWGQVAVGPLGRLLEGGGRLLLRAAASRHHQAQRRLVSGRRFSSKP